MNKLLQKLHANKVNMRIMSFDIYCVDSISIQFSSGIHHKHISIDLRHLAACQVSAEDILILELEAFLSEAGLEVVDENM